MVRGPWGDRRTRAVLVPVGFSRVVSVCRHVPDRTSSWIIIPVPQYWDGYRRYRGDSHAGDEEKPTRVPGGRIRRPGPS